MNPPVTTNPTNTVPPIADTPPVNNENQQNKPSTDNQQQQQQQTPKGVDLLNDFFKPKAKKQKTQHQEQPPVTDNQKQVNPPPVVDNKQQTPPPVVDNKQQTSPPVVDNKQQTSPPVNNEQKPAIEKENPSQDDDDSDSEEEVLFNNGKVYDKDIEQKAQKESVILKNLGLDPKTMPPDVIIRAGKLVDVMEQYDQQAKKTLEDHEKLKQDHKDIVEKLDIMMPDIQNARKLLYDKWISEGKKPEKFPNKISDFINYLIQKDEFNTNQILDLKKNIAQYGAVNNVMNGFPGNQSEYYNKNANNNGQSSSSSSNISNIFSSYFQPPNAQQYQRQQQQQQHFNNNAMTGDRRVQAFSSQIFSDDSLMKGESASFAKRVRDRFQNNN